MANSQTKFFRLPEIGIFTAVRETQWEPILLFFSMLMTGAAGLITEYVLCTVSSNMSGDATVQWGIIISVMLGTMGFGSFAQKFIKKNLLEWFVIIEISIAILAAFAPISLYYGYGLLEDVDLMLVKYSLISSIGFLIGFEIPLVTRINETYSKNLKNNLGLILLADYLGCLIAAGLWLYMIKHFQITEISFLVAGANFAVALLTFTYFSRKKETGAKFIKASKSSLSLFVNSFRGVKFVFCKLQFAFVIPMILTAFVLGYGYTNVKPWQEHTEQKMFDDFIICKFTSIYQQFVMTFDSFTDEYWFYINGNTQFSSADEEIYHEQLVHPVMALVPEHEDILVLGGGDGFAVRELNKYETVESILLVDLDPAMTHYAANDSVMVMLNDSAFHDARVVTLENGAISPDGMIPVRMETGKIDSIGNDETLVVDYVQIMNMDADKFLEKIKGSFNVIIIDFPDPSNLAVSKLYSKEFFMKLRRKLSQHGMIAIQSTSPYHAKEAYLMIGRTMEAAGFNVLPYHDNVPSFGEWGWYLAWKSNMPKEVLKEKIAAIDSFEVKTDYLTPELFVASTVFSPSWLESKFAGTEYDISTLMHPVILEVYLNECWRNE